MLPACCFASFRLFPRPVRLSAPPLTPACYRCRRSQYVKPATASTSGSTCRLSRPPLPFGIVTSLRLKAFCQSAACQPAIRFRPISVRSPQPFSITRTNSYGSPFPVRYVFGGSLFLKPLGTTLNMRPERAFRQLFSALFDRFSAKNIPFQFSELQADLGGIAVHKSRPRDSVLRY